MKFDALLGPSYTLYSPKAEIQRSVNCFRQRIETGEGAGSFALMRSPGLIPVRQPSSLGAGAFRGGFELNNLLYVIIDASIFLLFPNYGINFALGPISNIATNFVRMANSTTSIMFVSDNILYRVFNSSTLSTPTVSFTPQDVAWIGNYFVAIDVNNNLWWSADDGATWSAANFQVLPAAANNNIACIVQQNVLYIYNNRLIQPFIVGPNPNAPFQPQQSGISPYGLQAFGSLQTLGNTRCWLGRNKDGQGVIYRGENFSVQKISNSAVDNAIRVYTANGGTDNAVGMSFQQNGQDFYRITFPSANGGYGATWELNATVTNQTGVPEWEELTWTNFQTGKTYRHRANIIVSAFGKILAGDYQNGWLYEMAPSVDILGVGQVVTDFGFPQNGNRRAPHIVGDTNHRVAYDELVLGAQTGVGLQQPMWLQNYTLNPVAFAAAVVTQQSLGNLTVAQAALVTAIYNLTPYVPFATPYPSPDTMNALGFTPWGAPAVLSNGTILDGTPTIGMAYSNDGGVSFNARFNRSLGNAGQIKQVHWSRQGMSRDRVYDFTWNHPCPQNLTTAWFNGPEQLTS